MSDDFCCQNLRATTGTMFTSREPFRVAEDGSLSVLGSEGFVEVEGLPYCPWCGTKLLKEATDG